MNDNNDDTFDHKASKTKTVVFLVMVGAVLLIGLLLIQIINSSGSDDMMDSGVMPSTTEIRSPDPVKESAGPNGGTTPSPTGTGPGSDNSLLGQ